MEISNAQRPLYKYKMTKAHFLKTLTTNSILIYIDRQIDKVIYIKNVSLATEYFFVKMIKCHKVKVPALTRNEERF